MINLSYSKIKRFLICPYIYKWVELDKKEFRHHEKYIKKSIILHAIEKYLLYLAMNKKKKDPEYVEFIFDELWGFGVDKLLNESNFNEIKNSLLNYANKNLNLNNIYKIGLIDSFYFRKAEIRIGVKFPRIDKLKNNKIVVYDYKFGEDENMIKDPLKDLWSQIYILGLYNIFEAFDNYSIKRINLTTGNEFELQFAEKEKLQEILLESIDRLLLTINFNPQKNYFCDFCYIKKIGECAYSKEYYI